MKRLIVCCDGTANDPDQMDRDRIAPTNVVKFTRALKHKTSSGILQLTYYDQGVGTGWWAKRIIEGFSGAGISQNIKEAYYFLAKNYEPGDEIFCFGFSRGSYTVRSLCGMIHTCGLLKSECANEAELIETYERYGSYRESEENVSHNSKIYPENADHYYDDVKVKFIGVWDTVGSLGFPLIGSINFEWNKHHKINKFPETVQHAYHALAVDEFRKAFRPDMMSDEDVEIKLEQKWFVGSHSNIGGGYVDSGLSDLSLEAMIDYTKHPKKEGKTNPFNLEFEDELIKNNNFINGDPFGELRNSRSGFYTIVPVHHRKLKNNHIPEHLLHKSVIERILDPTSGYFPANIDIKKIKGKEQETHVEEQQGAKTNFAKGSYSIPKIYQVSRKAEKMDQKYYKRTEDLKPDKFPIYLTNGSVGGLLIWLIITILWVSSSYVFGVTFEDYSNFFLGVLTLILKVVLIPALILAVIVGVSLLGFTISSSIAKRKRRRMLKRSKQSG